MKKSSIVIGLFLFLAGCQTASSPDLSRFVRVNGTRLEIQGRRYCFTGTNFWYGCNLGALSEGGDRDRLIRELDLLKSLGIDNLRVLGASEGGTQHNTVKPPIQTALGQYDEALLEGLDFLLSEMGKRGMKAVVYLNNYWVWSGGMAQYLSWLEDVPVPNPFLETYHWTEFMEFSARFYKHEEANEAFRRYIKMLVLRKNTFTGILYRDDPTIMAWQLGNEPRPGWGESGERNVDDFKKWMGKTADYIRSLDPNHLISTGNEGLAGCLWSEKLLKDIHLFEDIDYMTVHLWIFNWQWYDPLNPEKTYTEAEEKAIGYLDDHIRIAGEIGKPLVLEEFGIPRDFHSYSPTAGTAYRDRYYRKVLDHIFENARSGGPFAGSNFWGWGGYGKALDPEEAVWREGDEFTGDPPQEPQGLNSVFAADSTTLDVLRTYAGKMEALNKD